MQLATVTVTGNGTMFVDGQFVGYYDTVSHVFWWMDNPTARLGISYRMPTVAALQAFVSDGGMGQLGPFKQYEEVPLPAGWQAATL